MKELKAFIERNQKEATTVFDTAYDVAQEALQLFQQLSPEDALLNKLSSFAVGCALAGDIITVPAGMLVVEKSVNSNTFGVRSVLHHLHMESLPSLLTLNDCLTGSLARASAHRFHGSVVGT